MIISYIFESNLKFMNSLKAFECLNLNETKLLLLMRFIDLFWKNFYYYIKLLSVFLEAEFKVIL
jgi:hypothetical protein